MQDSADASARLIEGLQNPAAYSHPVDDVRVTETHISWVFLTGKFAYKVKKPVTLGFLDFSTIARRKKFCDEELRLNSRYSPDLYLDVLPITGSHDQPHVGGKGDAIEYAVKMRQFPDDALLSRQLRANTVTPEHIDSLARTVAEFHSRAEIATPESPWGTHDAVWAPVAENFRQLELANIDAPEVARLHRWSEAEFHRLREVFDQRKRDGFVRECHGDLHARNILLLDGELRLFDCVEFNENFRWVDVLSDLAFACMDFADFGRSDFAHRLLDAYLQLTGDYEGLAVWRYYFVYRALVRAKVAAIRSTQAETPDQSTAAIGELQKYLELAERAAQSERPRLIITHGPSGSGKSTLTQPLLEQIGAVRVRSDVERRRLTADDSAEARYSAEERRRVYARLAELSAAILRAGMTVIVDATFLDQADRHRFRDLASRLDAPFSILDFQTPVDVLRERIANRRNDVSEADRQVLDAQLASADPLDGDERASAIALDTTAADPLARVVASFHD